MNIENWKVVSRLGLGYAVLLVLLLAVALFGFISLELIRDNQRSIGQVAFPQYMLAQTLSESEYKKARDMRTLVITEDLAIMRGIKEGMDKTQGDFDAAWEALQKLPLSAQSQALLSRIKEASTAVAPFNAKVIEMGLANQAKEAEPILLNQAFPGNRKVQALIAEFMELQERSVRQSFESSEQLYGQARFWMAVMVGCAAVAAIMIGWLVTRSIIRPLGGEPAEVQALMRRLAEGDLSTLLEVREGDRDSMAAAINTMVGTLKRLAVQAETIGRGDFSQDLVPLSERDQLGMAISDMNRMLRAAKEESDARNWVKDGYTRLSAELSGGGSVQQQAETAITVLGRYLAVGRGVLYLYRQEENALDLLGSYMHVERAQLGSRFLIGEGAIGQVAREKKPIILTAVAPDATPVVTGTVSAAPYYTYTYPLLREGVLLGVAELAGFERFDALKLEFLLGATEMIAAFLFVAEQQEQVRRLLAVAEAAEREARAQSERLQEANTLMEEQQQQLQQQAEELRQSNAQLEEQQQQLQQQSEELEQSNAQLEEQQEELQQSYQKLRLSREELDARAKQLELSGQYKSEFLANMSHELRTPLNAIILLSKMMAGNREGHLSPEEVRQAEIIHCSGEDLLRLINDVLDLSKVEAGHMEVHQSEVDSAALANSSRDMFEHMASERNLTFTIDDRIKGSFVSDVDKIVQVMRNLLSNAFKFTKQGGVTLTLERRAGEALPIRIEVRDSGIGIPPEKQALIFEAFHQVDGSTSREYGGTGLGLTISRRFARLLGGDIELESMPGQGSVFVLRLPDLPADQAVPANTDSRPAPIRSVSAPVAAVEPMRMPRDDRDRLAPGDRVILLVDDDPLFGEALIDLNRRLGYKTLVAANGADGLALAGEHRPAGILLDLGLPDMDGASVLHAMKTDPALASIPVYVISARDRDVTLLRQGIVGYLQKPVDIDQLARAESEVLAAGASLLVVASGGIDAGHISELLGSRCAQVRQCAGGDELRVALAEGPWRLAVVDLTGRSVDDGLADAEIIRQADAGIAQMFFTAQHLDESEEARLRDYSDSIIVKTSQVDLRLLQDIEHFLLQAPQAQSGRQSAVGAKSGAAGKRLLGRRILVVDDDPRNLFVITAALEQCGAVVIGAINGSQALELLPKTPVDLIITDIMMPVMDGYQTIAGIRGNPALAGIPVIALTAKALPEDKEKVLAAGANDFLSKPVDYDLLVNMIDAWCSRR